MSTNVAAARPDTSPGLGCAIGRVGSARIERPLRGLVALVAGGGSGIGRASALALTGRGASVVVAGLRPGVGLEADAARGRDQAALVAPAARALLL